MPNVHIDFSLEGAGCEAYENGKPCEPPDRLGQLQEKSWAEGWLEAKSNDPSNNYNHPPSEDTSNGL